MNRLADLLLDNLWWPFIGGVLIGAACVATAWLLGKFGRRT